MNGNALQKLYGSLTPRERLAAELAARARGDDGECSALGRTAPKVRYEVTHHAFLEDAFRRLAMLHVLRVLDWTAAFYMGQGVLFLEDALPDSKRFDTMLDNLTALAKVIVFHVAAWDAFCGLMGIDPGAALLDIPGSGHFSPGNPMADKAPGTIELLLRAARVLAPEEPDPAEVAELARVYQEVLYDHAGKQSGGWG